MMTAMVDEDGKLSSLLVIWDESASKVSSHPLQQIIDAGGNEAQRDVAVNA
jgi:hypothetical protein